MNLLAHPYALVAEIEVYSQRLRSQKKGEYEHIARDLYRNCGNWIHIPDLFPLRALA